MTPAPSRPPWTDDEFDRWYGPWAARTPHDVAALLADYPGVWWVAGGWALQAFTGVERPHEDIDPATLRQDLPALRRHLAPRLHTWTAASGTLRPLRPDDAPDGPADDVLPEGCGQVWTRRDATSPWEFDILLSPGTPRTWVYKRDPGLTMPMADALWTADGVPYLQPEIQLLYKAQGLRPKDQRDFDATLPALDRGRRSWLADALARTLPGHPWLGALS
ncbi:nucleotidyltransferase domain-containing protein [Isoptericola sp. NPDC055881]